MGHQVLGRMALIFAVEMDMPGTFTVLWSVLARAWLAEVLVHAVPKSGGHTAVRHGSLALFE